MKKYLIVIILIGFIVPSVAFASWWNPFSWRWSNLFHKKEAPQSQVINSEQEDDSSEEVKKLQEQIDELKKQQQNIPPTVPKKTVPVVDNSAALKINVEEQAKLDAQKALEISNQQAFQIKVEKLNAINQEIADLNAKYATDLEAARHKKGQERINAAIQQINAQYTIDYNKLMAEFQQIQYSN